ncbi:hypothetical protein LUX32_00065 [Actinomadura madurae]|nr:hypothetical protein [Actinomadura madurae]MCP9976262.1 hypothetical protein [Actinomadura madurae]
MPGALPGGLGGTPVAARADQDGAREQVGEGAPPGADEGGCAVGQEHRHGGRPHHEGEEEHAVQEEDPRGAVQAGPSRGGHQGAAQGAGLGGLRVLHAQVEHGLADGPPGQGLARELVQELDEDEQQQRLLDGAGDLVPDVQPEVLGRVLDVAAR